MSDPFEETMGIHADRIRYFQKRVAELGRTFDNAVMVIVSWHDENGPALAEHFGMPPGWEEPFLALGLAPYARGLQDRESVQRMLDVYGKTAADGLREAKGCFCVVVFDHEKVAVFEVAQEDSTSKEG